MLSICLRIAIFAVASDYRRWLPRLQVLRVGAVRFTACAGVGIVEQRGATAAGLGLSEAIGLLRDELLKARTSGAGSDIQLPVESMTVELSVTATRSADGKAGFTVPVVGLKLGGGGSRERGSEQKVTIVFGAPLDRAGRPVKVASASELPPG